MSLRATLGLPTIQRSPRRARMHLAFVMKKGVVYLR